LDHATPSQVAQYAYARHLQDVADLVGLGPGRGAKAGLPVGARDVDAVNGDRVKMWAWAEAVSEMIELGQEAIAEADFSLKNSSRAPNLD
jgi:hypothetical protein